MPQKPELYLAIDLGAESGRCIIGSFDGARVSLEGIHRFPNAGVRLGDGLYWDALRLWTEIKIGLRLAAQKYRDLKSVGLDTWGVDFALLDRNDELLANPRHYRDPRNEGMMERAFERVSREEIFESTGIQFLRINSLYQLLSLRLVNSPILDAAKTFLMIPDLFNFWLTGTKVCEFTDATTSQCYDPRKRQWATSILQALDIPPAMFREVVQPGASLGPIVASVARECDCRLEVIAPACHDTGSAIVAVPAETAEWAYLSSGTWSLIGIEVPEPIINEQSLRHNFTNEGGACGTFRFLKNIMGLWLAQECRRAWGKAGEDVTYKEMMRLAEAASPFASLIDPDHASFIAPESMPQAIQAFCRNTNQREPRDRGALTRCALESLALKYRQTLEQLEQISGRKIKVLHVVGGGSQNRLLNQFTADACQRQVVAGPVEATATGNVLMQALAHGRICSLADVREIVRKSLSLEVYEPRDVTVWEEAYQRWLKVAALRS